MARYFIILVCFDRYILTNINFNLRAPNQLAIAKRLVASTTLFWRIFGSHQLMFTTIDDQRCGQREIYNIINGIYLFISFSIIPSILMIEFGYLIYHQVSQVGTQKKTIN